MSISNNTHNIIDYLKNLNGIKININDKKDNYIFFSTHSSDIIDDDIINCDKITHLLLNDNINIDNNSDESSDNLFNSISHFLDNNINLDIYYKSINNSLYITFKSNNNNNINDIPNQIKSFIINDIERFNKNFSKIIFTGLDFEGDIGEYISNLFNNSEFNELKDSKFVKITSNISHDQVCCVLSDASYYIKKDINNELFNCPVEISSFNYYLCREEKLQRDVKTFTYSSNLEFLFLEQYDELIYYYDPLSNSLYVAIAGTDNDWHNDDPSRKLELLHSFLIYLGEQEGYINKLWNHVKENLNEFIFGNNQINKDNMKIFFTGHSRGGFIANKLFQKFIECYSFPFVYLRTFGIPASFNNSIQNRDEINNGLMNVVSYCNSNDKVIESLSNFESLF